MSKLNLKTCFVFYTIILIVSILVFIPVDTIVYENYMNISSEYFVVNICVYSPIVLLCIFVVHIANSKFDTCNIILKFLSELLIVAICVIIIIALEAQIAYRLNGDSIDILTDLKNRIKYYYFYIDIIEGAFVLLLTNMIYFYNQKRIIELEREKYKYKHLKQTLNPHFLFNSLNTLSAINYTANNENISEYISNLSDIYRYILDNDEKDLNTLEEELIFLEKYTLILRYRFGENLIIKTNIPEYCLQYKVLFMSLQLLVENAVKHNIVNSDSPLLVNIFCENNFVVVQNNINLKEKFFTKSNGIGLKNLNERYIIFAKQKIVKINDGKNFIIKIPMI